MQPLHNSPLHSSPLPSAPVARTRALIVACGGLVAMSDVARMWGCARARVLELSRLDDFPRPVGTVATRTPVWLLAEIEAWRARRSTT